MPNNFYKCGQCALRQPKGQTCQLTNQPYKDNDTACAHFHKSLPKCNFCGQAFLEIKNVLNDKLICDNCLNLLDTCRTCAQSSECLFESSTSTLPKLVQKVIQQGGMQISTQIRNPERIKITCALGCKCYSNGECQRDFNYCPNYKSTI